MNNTKRKSVHYRERIFVLVGAGGFTLRVKFVRYANRRILCPSRLRQGEPTRDGQRGSNPP